MAKKQIRFAELLTLHVNNTIKKQFLNESLTPQLLRSMRDCVHRTISDVFMRSSHTLSPKALNWLSNQYFKSIKLNGSDTVEDITVFNDYPLSELTFSDVQLMRNLFNETALSTQLEEEYRRRSTS